jgi:hypothetical protein
MTKEMPQPTPIESAIPAPFSPEQLGDLSHDITKRNNRTLKGAAGIAVGAVFASSIGAAAQEEQPSQLPETNTMIMGVDLDKNGDGQVQLGEIIVSFPEIIEAGAQRINETAEQALEKIQEEEEKQVPEPKDLRELFNKKVKLPKGNLEEIRTELFVFLAENSEINEKVRAIKPDQNLEKMFEKCISAKNYEVQANNCNGVLDFLFKLHKISGSDQVYDWTGKFIGANNNLFIEFGIAEAIYNEELKNQKKYPELYK